MGCCGSRLENNYCDSHSLIKPLLVSLVCRLTANQARERMVITSKGRKRS